MGNGKFKVGKTYKTRDGGTARVLCTDAIAENFPIVALVTRENIQGNLWDFILRTKADGTACRDGGVSGLDLMPSTHKVEGWVNVYRRTVWGNEESPFHLGGTSYTTKAHASKLGTIQPYYLTTIKIEAEIEDE